MPFGCHAARSSGLSLGCWPHLFEMIDDESVLIIANDTGQIFRDSLFLPSFFFLHFFLSYLLMFSFAFPPGFFCPMFLPFHHIFLFLHVFHTLFPHPRYIKKKILHIYLFHNMSASHPYKMLAGYQYKFSLANSELSSRLYYEPRSLPLIVVIRSPMMFINTIRAVLSNCDT